MQYVVLGIKFFFCLFFYVFCTISGEYHDVKERDKWSFSLHTVKKSIWILWANVLLFFCWYKDVKSEFTMYDVDESLHMLWGVVVRMMDLEGEGLGLGFCFGACSLCNFVYISSRYQFLHLEKGRYFFKVLFWELNKRICESVLVAQLLFATLWTIASQAPLSTGVSRHSPEWLLQWVAIPFSRGSSWPRDQTWVFCITGRFFTIWATREASENMWKHFLNLKIFYLDR